MLMDPALAVTMEPEESCVPVRPLPAELDFYLAYGWCLDPHLTVREAIDHLCIEADRLKSAPGGWQAGEVATNIFLLSCAMSSATEEYLRGPTLRVPRSLATRPLGRVVRSPVDTLVDMVWRRRRVKVQCWWESCQAC